MTLLVLIGFLILIPFVYGFLVSRQRKSQETAASLGHVILVISVIGMSSAIYGFWMHDQKQIEWIDKRESLIPDVQALLKTNKATDRIKALEAVEFVSLLTYYGRIYPKDERVWQKLAVVMVSLQSPAEALKAVRRYLVSVPDDIQARQLELQLLDQLVQQKQGISSRQLEFALQKMLDIDELKPQDHFYLAGIARTHEFYNLAIAFWQAILDSDKRTDQELEPKALQGRLLLKRMIAEAHLQQQNRNETDDEDIKDDAAEEIEVESVAEQSNREIPRMQFELTLDDATSEAISEYLQSQSRFHLWVSLRGQEPGPPLAARLIWIDEQSLELIMQQEFGFEFGVSDLIVPGRGWNQEDKLMVSALLVLDHEKTDPLEAKATPFRSEELVDVKNGPVRIKILKP